MGYLFHALSWAVRYFGDVVPFPVSVNSWQQVGKPLIDPDQKARDIIHFSAVESIDFNYEANKMLITFEKNIKIIDYIAPQDLIIESNKIIDNTKMTCKEKELLGIKYSL